MPQTVHHVVLVPGFVGFDVLGQLAYYAGVTGVFDAWSRDAGLDVSIHYFDNFPTASVKHRANRLRSWLATRVARGEFAPGHSVALIGHSTGGLDIRRAIYDMAVDELATLTVDGLCPVEHRRILELVDRVAFLSVPQYGTNLADFGCSFASLIQALAKDAASGIQLNHGAFGRLRRLLFSALSGSPSNLVLALGDMLDESDEDPAHTVEQQAAEREARFELTAWLDNMAHDISTLADLRSSTGEIGGSDSPAHFSPSERRRELDEWKKHGIATRSYATRVPPDQVQRRAFARGVVAALRRAAPAVELGVRLYRRGPQRWLIPPIALASEAMRATELVSLPVVLEVLGRTPSLLFDVFHAVCADRDGPFRDPNTIAPSSIAPTLRRLDSGQPMSTTEIAESDSDGVVNTLSMLWPYDPTDPGAHPIDLVDADHGDVVGHFDLKPERVQLNPAGRRYYAYDFFQTAFKFPEARFEKLWHSVFDSCVSAGMGT